ncbi:MAG: HNH endonuclease [Bdellovibrionaceae bacterium]|nr:HNH endonuclease [Pseudobdellovibrionaceae bacterium]MBX3034514.1 HNH endonuclease [Pseudobdellovibrionaceae bacterium]
MSNIASMRALLLNSGYEPMRIVSWQKALVLWFQGKVEIVEAHPVFARSVSSSFPIPSVIRLKSYVRPRPRGAIRFCRENVYIRDDYTCQYCGEQFALKQLTLDHVVPASMKGRKTWTNVVTACRDCNQRKADRTPDEAAMPLLSTPRAPGWLPVVQGELRPGQVPVAWLQYLTRAG